LVGRAERGGLLSAPAVRGVQDSGRGPGPQVRCGPGGCALANPWIAVLPRVY